MFSIDVTKQRLLDNRKKLPISILKLGLMSIALLLIPYLPYRWAIMVTFLFFYIVLIGCSVGMAWIIAAYLYLVFIDQRIEEEDSE